MIPATLSRTLSLCRSLLPSSFLSSDHSFTPTLSLDPFPPTFSSPSPSRLCFAGDLVLNPSLVTVSHSSTFPLQRPSPPPPTPPLPRPFFCLSAALAPRTKVDPTTASTLTFSLSFFLSFSLSFSFSFSCVRSGDLPIQDRATFFRLSCRVSDRNCVFPDEGESDTESKSVGDPSIFFGKSILCDAFPPLWKTRLSLRFGFPLKGKSHFSSSIARPSYSEFAIIPVLCTNFRVRLRRVDADSADTAALSSSAPQKESVDRTQKDTQKHTHKANRTQTHQNVQSQTPNQTHTQKKPVSRGRTVSRAQHKLLQSLHNLLKRWPVEGVRSPAFSRQIRKRLRDVRGYVRPQ